MNVTCGTDIVEIDRIKRSIDNYEDKFCEKIFTSVEQNYCEKFNANKYEHYAARFAAKEAVYKALSNYDDLDWRDIEIDITLSHCKTYATAYVVATFE